jgi:hypothetical protein
MHLFEHHNLFEHHKLFTKVRRIRTLQSLTNVLMLFAFSSLLISLETDNFRLSLQSLLSIKSSDESITSICHTCVRALISIP